MLSDEERREIEAEVARYPDRRAVAVEALKIVQRHRRWISDEALLDVAGAVGLSVHQLDAVATFYNLVFRRPVGRHVILLCDSVSCWIGGCDRLASRLRERLRADKGELSEGGRFTWLPAACLGACERAPALLLDGELHDGVTPERLDALLDAREGEG